MTDDIESIPDASQITDEVRADAKSDICEFLTLLRQLLGDIKAREDNEWCRKVKNENRYQFFRDIRRCIKNVNKNQSSKEQLEELACNILGAIDNAYSLIHRGDNGFTDISGDLSFDWRNDET